MRRFGLIGRKLSHSFSAKYFAEKFERESLSDECRYDLFEMEDISCVEEFIASTEGLVGFNVTIPYKQQIIPYLTSLSDEARNIGAVNCVKLLSDGSRIGYNTDVDGVRVSLDKLLGADEIEYALVLGTGGASQAVQYVLAERGISCNVHYKPLPMHTAYKELGFCIDDYPNAHSQYLNEVTLPLNTKMNEDDVCYVIENIRNILGE